LESSDQKQGIPSWAREQDPVSKKKKKVLGRQRSEGSQFEASMGKKFSRTMSTNKSWAHVVPLGPGIKQDPASKVAKRKKNEKLNYFCSAKTYC
jgi:hypothetical protein